VIFDSQARRRIPRIVWPILIGVVVAVALMVSASSDETRAELRYLEEMRAQATEMAKDGDGLRDAASRLDQVDRNAFMTVIDTIREDLAAGLDFVAEDPPAPSLLSVRAMYRQALTAWDRGVDGFGAAVLAAADNPDSSLAYDMMAGALVELRAGDGLYADLVADMRHADVPDPLIELPAAELSPGEGDLVRLSASYVDSARSEGGGLPLRSGLAVSQILADPKWRVTSDDEAVLPVAEIVVFSVVVSNAGNVAVEAGSVALTLSGGGEERRLTSEVGRLAPDERVTISFEPLSVEAGEAYAATAAVAAVEGDADTEDNKISVQFTVASP